MCDSRIGKFFAPIGGYFATPTFGKEILASASTETESASTASE